MNPVLRVHSKCVGRKSIKQITGSYDLIGFSIDHDTYKHYDFFSYKGLLADCYLTTYFKS